MFKIFKFIKDFLLFFPLSVIFHPFAVLLNKGYYFNKLIFWIRKNKSQLLLNDFYKPVRDSSTRPVLYKFISDNFDLVNNEITYVEFGVFKGTTFKWWIANNLNQNSNFFGFDTFEGLPENWGFYKKGDMLSAIPEINDSRAIFIKGLFQDTLVNFIQENRDLFLLPRPKVIHLDADLYSSTLFALTQMYPYLNKGDFIIFDEFNVPLHEFKAYSEFVSSFNVKLKPIVALNNFYQTAFIVE